MFASTRSRRNANKRRRRSSLSSVRPPLANVTASNKKKQKVRVTWGVECVGGVTRVLSHTRFFLIFDL
jgi:hypothetical protein